MTPDEQIAHVEGMMEKLRRGDMRGAAEFLHEDFRLVEQPGMPYEGEWLGRDGFIQLFEAIGSTWARWKDDPYPWVLASVDNKVFKEVRFKATLAANGAQIEMDFVEVMEFRDDLIAEVRPYYWDPSRIADALARQAPVTATP